MVIAADLRPGGSDIRVLAEKSALCSYVKHQLLSPPKVYKMGTSNGIYIYFAGCLACYTSLQHCRCNTSNNFKQSFLKLSGKSRPRWSEKSDVKAADRKFPAA